LPDGTVLIYGGWHPHGRTFSDVWAAYAGDKATDFVARLPARHQQMQGEEEEEDDEDEMDRRFHPLLAQLRGGNQAELRRQLLGIMTGQPFTRLRQGGEDSGDEDEDEEDEDEEEDEEEEEEEVVEGHQGEQPRQDTGAASAALQLDDDALEQAFAEGCVGLTQERPDSEATEEDTEDEDDDI